ncbi:hypothetical protein LTR16_001238 [Cryomyces antarcticus]|uniref:Cytochrome b561 domain-containing protein n=1 Tax=Cryomyces antarcticus TaxID=329879 RepID=A0ABR0KVZ6_9PEZI|nr:hypothetical protein LTR39_001116 [Cryomyces antarcticus]KAK5020319.1 hypothetical protein LTR60_000624 [Cryomyces antarcticus]KAK5130826.1 hypothetical protein LTR16_001238 [Cryomyces antarcticus]
MRFSSRNTLAALALASTAFAQDGGQDGGLPSPSEIAKTQNIIIAHGIMMGIAFAVLFPFGAIIMRLFKFRGVVWFHAGWQIFTYIVALAAFGLGVWLAVLTNQLVTPNGHSIIGIIVIGMLFFQPIGGLLHHHLYAKHQAPTAVGTGHRWIGRVFIILGTINGGLGLQLATEGKGPTIAYSVLAAFFFALWFVVVMVGNLRAKETRPMSGRKRISSETSLAERNRSV